MGILYKCASGELDFVHGDVENLADPRTWPRPKKATTEYQTSEDDSTKKNVEKGEDDKPQSVEG